MPEICVDWDGFDTYDEEKEEARLDWLDMQNEMLDREEEEE